MGHHGDRKIGIRDSENPFDGIRITYMRGEKCDMPHDPLDGEESRTLFEIECDEKITDIDWQVKFDASD